MRVLTLVAVAWVWFLLGVSAGRHDEAARRGADPDTITTTECVNWCAAVCEAEPQYHEL